MSHALCLLFDCDGTLVDSEPLLAEVMTDTLTRVGLPFAPHIYMQEFRGIRFAQIVAELERRHGALDPMIRAEAEAQMRQAMQERMAVDLLPIPGIHATLEALGQYPRCVASNGPEYKIQRALDTTGLRRYFEDRLFSAYTVNSWKPEPGLFLHAAETMGYAPEQCVVIDDAAVGVAAGLAAGMRVVHINRFADSEATPEGAISLHDMTQLPALVERLAQRERVLP
ncbi:HAD-IA family hydrolase [Halomonas sp. WWR20]